MTRHDDHGDGNGDVPSPPPGLAKVAESKHAESLHAEGGARGSQQTLDESVTLSIVKPEASGPEDVSALEAMQA